MILAENLDRYYADKHAVRDLNFELKQGDITGFLGPNGAGKSTTMQMLSGVLAPSAGRILINGIDLLDHPKQAKQQLGYLPEKPPVYPELSVDEYLIFCAQLRRIKKPNIKSAVDLALQRCNLTEVQHRIIGNLSKGYQQRVGIAQAIIHQPAVVILDEPTVGLDPIQVRQVRNLIKELSQQHSIILSTHILPEVQAICNRVQIIHQGKLVFSDSMSNINDSEQNSALTVAFDRPPPIDQLQALAGISEASDLGSGRFRLQAEDKHPMGELIVSASVAQDWGLQELCPEQQTLEQIFIELTSGEECAA
jgi:gliding motility-associated transport system ATP-binding protein